MKTALYWTALAAWLLTQMGCDQLGGLLGGGKEKASADETEEEEEETEEEETEEEETEEEEEEDEEPPKETGPVVTIPAGVLLAGSACNGVPRVTDEELVHESIPMEEFTIDALPYPNDPAQPPKVGVTQQEAAALCEADGKRLCTELEWERACKGDKNTAYEYGAAYKKDACKPGTTLGARPECVSSFGVKDMHGVVFEWTSSRWGRDDGADLMTVRGNAKTSDVVKDRCANGQGRTATEKSEELGFRCCSGPKNAAEVDLTIHRQAPMVEEPSVEAGLAAAMLAQMPADHQRVDRAAPTFDKMWRWRPRDNEELLIARWTVNPPRRRDPIHEIAVFKVCKGAPQRVARMTGPVDTMGSPGAGGNPAQASVSVSTGRDKGSVRLGYFFGSVSVTQPDFVKAGNSLPEDKKEDDKKEDPKKEDPKPEDKPKDPVKPPRPKVKVKVP